MRSIKMNCFTFFLLVSFSHMSAQEVISLAKKGSSDELQYNVKERQYFSQIWQTEVVTNVENPTLTVYQPENPNGTSIVVCPGGGMYALSIFSEGRDVAKWFADRGVTAFLLKYRLASSGEDGTQEIMSQDPAMAAEVSRKVAAVTPLAINDGLAAITYIRKNATKYELDPSKIGIVGFSAGGAVVMGATYNYAEQSRPDFIIPVYAWMDVLPKLPAPSDAPPMNVVCATDDPLNLAPASIRIYNDWAEAKFPVELHMYSKGGHGFGMRKQDLPSDQWIYRVGEWMENLGLMKM